MDATKRIVRATLMLALLGAGSLAQASVVRLGCYIQFTQPASPTADAIAPGCLARDSVWIGSHVYVPRGSPWKAARFQRLGGSARDHGDAAPERGALGDAAEAMGGPVALDAAYSYQTPNADFGGGRAALPWQSMNPLSAGGLAWVIPAQGGKLTGIADPRRVHPVGSPSLGHGVAGTPVADGAGGTSDAGGGTTGVSVPEPGTLALLGLGLLLFGLKRLLPWWFRGAARWREKELFPDSRRRPSIAA